MTKRCIIGFFLVFGLPSFAGQTDNLRVHVHVKPSCRIKSYHPTHWSVLPGTFYSNIDNSSGSIVTQCTRGIFYTVGLNNGQHYDATTMNRRLSDHHGHYVTYAVYSDPGFSRPWLSVGTPYALPLVGAGNDQTSVLYARIPQGQNPVPAGHYEDSIMVSIHF